MSSPSQPSYKECLSRSLGIFICGVRYHHQASRTSRYTTMLMIFRSCSQHVTFNHCLQATNTMEKSIPFAEHTKREFSFRESQVFARSRAGSAGTTHWSEGGLKKLRIEGVHTVVSTHVIILCNQSGLTSQSTSSINYVSVSL